MTSQINSLSVFIASPGDVSEERDIARKIIDKANRIFRPKTNWLIQPVMWEDTTPSYGRPQAIINPGVDSCDLFIGILWRRWGQPTGEYDSGFEEEYERALKRRKETGEPEIWIFFKEIEKAQLDDPGEQLKKVISFQGKLSKSQELLYKKFNSSGEWEDILDELLHQHILSLILPTQQKSQFENSALAIQNDKTVSTDLLAGEDLNNDPAYEQLSELINVVGGSINTKIDNPDKEDNYTLSELDICRLYLFSKALMNSQVTESLGVHEVNKIYLYREQIFALLLNQFCWQKHFFKISTTPFLVGIGLDIQMMRQC